MVYKVNEAIKQQLVTNKKAVWFFFLCNSVEVILLVLHQEIINTGDQSMYVWFWFFFPPQSTSSLRCTFCLFYMEPVGSEFRLASSEREIHAPFSPLPPSSLLFWLWHLQGTGAFASSSPGLAVTRCQQCVAC